MFVIPLPIRLIKVGYGSHCGQGPHNSTLRHPLDSLWIAAVGGNFLLVDADEDIPSWGAKSGGSPVNGEANC